MQKYHNKLDTVRNGKVIFPAGDYYLVSAADERIAALTLDRDVTIQFLKEAEKRVKQLTADLSKPPQERIHCKGCSLPDEKQGLKQQIVALKETGNNLRDYLTDNQPFCPIEIPDDIWLPFITAIGKEEGK